MLAAGAANFWRLPLRSQMPTDSVGACSYSEGDCGLGLDAAAAAAHRVDKDQASASIGSHNIHRSHA